LPLNLDTASFTLASSHLLCASAYAALACYHLDGLRSLPLLLFARTRSRLAFRHAAAVLPRSTKELGQDGAPSSSKIRARLLASVGVPRSRSPRSVPMLRPPVPMPSVSCCGGNVEALGRAGTMMRSKAWLPHAAFSMPRCSIQAHEISAPLFRLPRPYPPAWPLRPRRMAGAS